MQHILQAYSNGNQTADIQHTQRRTALEINIVSTSFTQAKWRFTTLDTATYQPASPYRTIWVAGTPFGIGAWGTGAWGNFSTRPAFKPLADQVRLINASRTEIPSNQIRALLSNKESRRVGVRAQVVLSTMDQLTGSKDEGGIINIQDKCSSQHTSSSGYRRRWVGHQQHRPALLTS